MDRIRQAAVQIGERRFFELLCWHRVGAGLPGPDLGTPGAYWVAITEQVEDRAVELLGDLRRLASHPVATATAPTANPATVTERQGAINELQPTPDAQAEQLADQ